MNKKKRAQLLKQSICPNCGKTVVWRNGLKSKRNKKNASFRYLHYQVCPNKTGCGAVYLHNEYKVSVDLFAALWDEFHEKQASLL
jgi:predicted RNA-binding Zn-ribbon protein involved in translation (DUF1610 family)